MNEMNEAAFEGDGTEIVQLQSIVGIPNNGDACWFPFLQDGAL